VLVQILSPQKNGTVFQLPAHCIQVDQRWADTNIDTTDRLLCKRFDQRSNQCMIGRRLTVHLPVSDYQRVTH